MQSRACREKTRLHDKCEEDLKKELQSLRTRNRTLAAQVEVES
jgi:hypothetical protein